MKNKFLVLPIIAVLFFSGCFSLEVTEEESASTGVDKHHADPVSYEGVLKAQTGVYAGLPGTHYVDLDAGTKSPVASLMINLSNEDYLNNRVYVTGALKETNAGEEFLEVEKIDVLETLDAEGEKIEEDEKTEDKEENDSKDENDEVKESSEKTSDSDYSKILNIIRDNAVDFSSELANSEILRVEFVGDKYVYVYVDKSEDRVRYLFEYEFDGIAIASSEVLAKYEPGETTDWTLVEGSNPAAGKEKTVFIIAGEEVSSTVVKEGFRYFESSRYGFKLQYPSNWYYAGRSDSEDSIVYHYGFSDKPVTSDNEIIAVDVMKSDVGQFGGSLFTDLNDELQIRVSSSADNAELRNEIYGSIEISE